MKVALCLALGLSSLRVFGFLTDPWLSKNDIHDVIGEPARAVRQTEAPQDLKVVTWNIERGQEYDEILSVLRTLNADVLLLQEVDRDCRRTKYRNVARDLATALDMNWVAAGEFQEIGQARSRIPAITGQAILSRFPIEEATALPFKEQDRWRWSINPVQPRRGGRMALKARTGGVVLYNTHIESGGNERLQHAQMDEIIADQATLAVDLPVLVGGDFNNSAIVRSLSLSSLTHASFIDALGANAAERGPTSRGQTHPIDWIFIKHLAPAAGRVVHADAASDHSPVMVALGALAALAGTR
ncbi:MAG TPA: endonuclease/exonuclease/phosphatase family protein [Vicinamibacterales bacterium]